ncbi:MAG: hypothetical protein ACREBC_36910, partial [Pyrinomonadaceae bacterium]
DGHLELSRPAARQDAVPMKGYLWNTMSPRISLWASRLRSQLSIPRLSLSLDLACRALAPAKAAFQALASGTITLAVL